MRGLRKILIVDDDPALRRSLAEQLEQHGEFSVVECDTAAEALATAGRERFDAILLDIGLPDLDGRELCRRLRGLGVHFTQEPLDMGAVTTAVFDDTCGNLINLHQD